jgi:hypothetical protein
MSEATDRHEAEGVVERRAQEGHADTIGVPGPWVRPSKSSNLRWSTWRWRLGTRARARAET